MSRRRWLSRRVPPAGLHDAARLRGLVDVLTVDLERATAALRQVAAERDAARRDLATAIGRPAAVLGAAWCARCAQLEQTCRALDARLARAEGRHDIQPSPRRDPDATTVIGAVR